MPSTAAGLPPFVGREEESAELDRALSAARAGRGALVLVVGEPGIGKTRLADEFTARARAQGARVLWGRAWEGGGAPPFWPWVEIVRGLVAEAGADTLVSLLGERSRELVRLLPELGERLPETQRPAGLDAERARFLLFDATATLLRVAAETMPAVLVLDDLHAADQPSLLLLRFVARTLPTSRLVVLVLLREAEVRGSRWIAEVVGQLAREGRRVPLRGLAEADVAALVRGRTGRSAAPAVVQAIHGATGGNPLFVDEIVRLLVAEKELASGDRLPSLPIPEGVRQAIRRRCAPLGREASELLQLAAVLGRDFDLPALAGLAGEPADRLLEPLGDAIALGLVAPVAGHPGRYRFAHVLMRETLYEDLRPTDRLRRHRQAGDILERLHTADLEPHLAEIAHHHLEAAAAGDVERAIRYATRAAEHALSQLAHEDAARHCELALQALASSGGPGEQRARLLLLLGEARRRAGDVARARTTFAEAADVARRLGAVELLARAALGFGHTGAESGASDRPLVALLEEALAAMGPADGALRAHLLGRLGEALYFSEDRARAAALTAEAVAMARRLDHPDVLATTLIRRHFTIWGPDTAAERLELSADAVRVAARGSHREVELVARSWHVAALLERGAAQEADREIAAYGELAESLRVPEFRWRSRLLSATRMLMRGEFEQAEDLAREAAAIESGANDPNAFQLFAVLRVALALEGGRRGALEEVAGTMAALAGRYPALLVWRSAAARVYAELGRTEEARRDLDLLATSDFRGVPRDGNWLPAMMNASETAVALGDARRAAVLHRLLRPYADLHVVVAHGACFGSVARYLGRLAAVQGRVRTAERHFAHAAAADAETGAAPFVAQSRYAWARLLVERGGAADRARTLLDGALATARALRMDRLVERAEVLAGRLARPGAASGAGAAPAARWTFRLEGDYWTLGGDGQLVRLRDARGMRYLRLLVSHPRRAFPATELAQLAAVDVDDGVRVASGTAGTVLDEQSRREYAGRLSELRAALDEARAHHDLGRIDRLESEIESLTAALAEAVGLGGRLRQAGSPVERARTAVTKAIRAAIRRITAENALVGHHLGRSVRTGVLCSYEPDPTRPVAWEP